MIETDCRVIKYDPNKALEFEKGDNLLGELKTCPCDGILINSDIHKIQLLRNQIAGIHKQFDKICKDAERRKLIYGAIEQDASLEELAIKFGVTTGTARALRMTRTKIKLPLEAVLARLRYKGLTYANIAEKTGLKMSYVFHVLGEIKIKDFQQPWWDK